MTYLLDTSVCIGLLRGKLPKTAAKLRTVPAVEAVLSAVIVYELFLGSEKCSNPIAEAAKVGAFVEAFNVLPFDFDAALKCAKIRAECERAGLPCGPYDYQIAASAKQHDLTVVTRNVTEYQRISQLRVEDWEI